MSVSNIANRLKNYEQGGEKVLKGLYTSALSLAVINRRQEVSANNLANANTVGYKKDTVVAGSFSNMLLYRLDDPPVTGNLPPVVGNIAMGVQLTGIVTDYSKGTQIQTGNQLQFALNGEGYFAVATPAGERYTRNGEFSLDSDGILSTIDGFPVLGKNGEIIVTAGEISVDSSGTVFAGDKKIDSLRVVTFSGTLQKEGASLFAAENPEEMENPEIFQGSVEESNANAITEMVNMIEIMRAYEANQKVLQTHDSTLEKAVNEIGRV